MTAASTRRARHPLCLQLKQTAEFIAAIQQADGAIPWYRGAKLDPWDHTEAAMALSVAGFHEQAEQAYAWLAQHQLSDGSWYAHYFIGSACDSLRETNFVAYIATGVWHHYLVTGNHGFLRDMYPCVARAIEFVLRQQSEHGEIAWAVGPDNKAEDDALVTACSSVLRSLDCAIRIAAALDEPASRWTLAAQRLLTALRDKPFRFDRSWPSKARYSMDWYYPLLANVFTGEDAKQRIRARWHEFVVDGLGCRCVNDEPWVTMAETSELVLALVACGELRQAESIYSWLEQWRDGDGGYWTGYVYRDAAFWPEEKTSWTAAAIILASDALFHHSAAGQLFSQPLLCRNVSSS